MKKKLLATALLSGMVLSVGSGALAAPLTPQDKLDANQGTVADFSDPSNGAKNYHKETSDVTVEIGNDPIRKTKGPYYKRLALAYVPTIYKFEGETGTAALVNQTDKKEKAHVVVNDDRRVSETDETYLNGHWKLTGQLSPLENAKGEKLDGVMRIKTSPLTKYYIGKEVATTDASGNTTVDYQVEKPTYAEAPAEAGAYTVQPSFDLKAGGDDAVTFLEKTGALTDFSHDATGVDKTGNRGVQTSVGDAELNLPTQAVEGSFSGYILWTLSAAI